MRDRDVGARAAIPNGWRPGHRIEAAERERFRAAQARRIERWRDNTAAERAREARVQWHTHFRDRYRRADFFNSNWYARHRNAWAFSRAWAPFTWTTYGTWFGLRSAAAPIYSDYGSNIYYSGDQVYIDNQPVGTAQTYYQSLATMIPATVVEEGGQWQALGVFALVGSDSDPNNSEQFFQLAVNREGQIRGNYFDKSSDTVLPIRGSVDRDGQRAAWIVGDDNETIYETGMYNLTREETTMMVHFDPAHNEVWSLVRLPEQAEGG